MFLLLLGRKEIDSNWLYFHDFGKISLSFELRGDLL